MIRNEDKSWVVILYSCMCQSQHVGLQCKQPSIRHQQADMVDNVDHCLAWDCPNNMI